MPRSYRGGILENRNLKDRVRPEADEADEAEPVFATYSLFIARRCAQTFLATCSPSDITSEFPQLSIHIS